MINGERIFYRKADKVAENPQFFSAVVLATSFSRFGPKSEIL